LLLELLPLLLDVLVDEVFARFQLSLGRLLVHDIRDEQFGLECLNHVLSIVELTVSFFNLLASQFILKLLLLGVNFSSRDL
jgi:hypothetical protein